MKRVIPSEELLGRSTTTLAGFWLAVLLVPLLAGSVCVDVVARTWIVAQDGTGDVSSVAAACEAASAGDSVLIRPGAYREEAHDDPMDPGIAIWEKPLSILGDGPAGSISLQMKFGFLDCDGVILSNLHMHDVTGAITIWGYMNYGGRYLIQSCRFEGNHARSYGGGAILVMGAVVTIEDCVFKGNQEIGGSEGGGPSTDPT